MTVIKSSFNSVLAVHACISVCCKTLWNACHLNTLTKFEFLIYSECDIFKSLTFNYIYIYIYIWCEVCSKQFE